MAAFMVFTWGHVYSPEPAPQSPVANLGPIESGQAIRLPQNLAQKADEMQLGCR
jgi:hypothetical protein